MTLKENVCFTGGSGLLGSAIKRLLPSSYFPTRSDLNVDDISSIEGFLKNKPKTRTLVHAAALTSPPKVDKDPIQAIRTNIIGTSNIAICCVKYDLKLVYISTDYVFSGDNGNYREEDPVFPINKYAWSKLGGECAVQLCANSLIIRGSFGPDEFPYEGAIVDQFTSRTPVSHFAKMVVDLIDLDLRGILHIGSERKSVYQYANEISPQKKINKIFRNSLAFAAPYDTSLNLEKYSKINSKI